MQAQPAGSRRIFLVMPHDWGRSPRYVANGQSELMRERTQAYNAFIADLAHQSSFTRLVASTCSPRSSACSGSPAISASTNVTDVRPKGGDPAKYLFDLNDDLHFGQRGQALIRQVVQYYLTKGWDWANTEKNPSQGAAEACR